MIPIIDAYIVCWNEEKIIRHTLNHYSTFCRRITLVDNYSSDDTVAITRKYFKDVAIESYDTNNEHRDDLLLEVKNNCWKNSDADYVIVCDTDEFLYAENMRGQLQKLHERKPVLPLVIGYNMGSMGFPGNYEIPIYDQVKVGIRERIFDKQIIFNPHVVEDINFTMGCHSCSPGFTQRPILDTIVEFKLLHFKYLSKEYLYEKHEAYASRLSSFNKKNQYGLFYLEGKRHIDKCFSAIERHGYQVV